MCARGFLKYITFVKLTKFRMLKGSPDFTLCKNDERAISRTAIGLRKSITVDLKVQKMIFLRSL